MATTGRKGGIINTVVGLAVLGVTIFVVGYAFKKGQNVATK